MLIQPCASSACQTFSLFLFVSTLSHLHSIPFFSIMNSRETYLLLMSAILAALISINLDFTAYTSPNSILSMLTCRNPISRRHHRHHDFIPKVNICDDFPPDIPPPETNTTVTLCVDHNGCCNFTKVQSAVDAVTDFNQKRTVIWINKGIY